jgi:hypothetical protein
VARSLGQIFAEVRVFPCVEKGWGEHFLAAKGPLHRYSATDLAARVPPAAARDMLEWGPATTVAEQFQKMLDGEVTLRELIDSDRNAPVLTDDRPVNEYYFLRHLLHGRRYFVMP